MNNIDRTDEHGEFFFNTIYACQHVTEVENENLTLAELKKKIAAFEEEDTIGNQELIDAARIEIATREHRANREIARRQRNANR